MSDQGFPNSDDRSLVALTVAGPIYAQVGAAISIPWPSAMLLLEELALRALDPTARVVSTIAEHNSGESAFLAHAHIQGMLVSQFRKWDVWTQAAFAAVLVSHTRDSEHGIGLEGIAASVANILWGRVPDVTAIEIVEHAGHLIAHSPYTLRYPMYVQERSGVMSSYEPGTVFHIDAHSMSSPMGNADAGQTTVQARSAAIVHFLRKNVFANLGTSGLGGAQQMDNWFGTDWRGLAGDPALPSFGLLHHLSAAESRQGADPDGAATEPFHPLTSKTRAGDSADVPEEVHVHGIKPVGVHIPDQKDPPPGDDSANSGSSKNHSSGQNPTNAGLTSTQKMKHFGEGMGAAGTVVGMFFPVAIPAMIFVGLVGVTLYVTGELMEEGALPTPKTKTPNPEDDSTWGRGSVPGGYRPHPIVVWIPGPKSGPSDKHDWPQAVHEGAFLDAPFHIVNPLYDPSDMLIADGDSGPPRSPANVIAVNRHIIYYVGPGTAALSTMVGPNQFVVPIGN